MNNNFIDDTIPEEIQSWHDYYQSMLADRDETIKQLETALAVSTKGANNGNEKRDTAISTGSDQQNGGEARFPSRCSKCGAGGVSK